MARNLWKSGYLVGASILDDLLFDAIRRRVSDPVLEVLEWLAMSSLSQPAYVLYPLHSFGIAGEGLFVNSERGEGSEEIAKAFGIAVCAQHNSIKSVSDWLSNVHRWFGVNGDVPEDLIDHWARSRASWIKRNPLLAVRVHTLTGSYYENQPLLIERLNAVTMFIAGLALRQGDEFTVDKFFSSRHANNWATLDIHHYIVMSSALDQHSQITGHAVPMNVDGVYLAELSRLPVDLNTKYWAAHLDEAQVLWDAVDGLAKIHLRSRFSRTKSDARTRTAVSLFRSMDYFRRSLSKEQWYAALSLGTAFETLLTSHYAPGVGERIVRRVDLLTGDAAKGELVGNLYAARSATAHKGASLPDSLDLREVQRIYLECFVIVASSLPGLAANPEDPLRVITRDQSANLRRRPLDFLCGRFPRSTRRP